MLAHARESRTLLASLVCAAAIACGGGSEGGNDNPGPSGQADAGQGGLMMGGMPGGGAAAGGQTGMGGMTAGGPGGQTGGAGDDAGTTPVVDAGPPDLGEDSKDDTFFRVDTLVLKAPNMYVDFFGKVNVTVQGQAELDKALTMDGDGDGFVDLSSLIRFFKTKDPKAANSTTTAGGGMCPMPVGPDKPCGPDKTFPFQPAVGYSNSQQACTLVGTQETAPAPCFITELSSLTMELPILGAVPLQESQIVGTWDGANISNGLVRGFLNKSTAEATKLGAGVPAVLALAGVQTGTPLVKFFSMDEVGKNSEGEEGWWILMSYTAKPATFDSSISAP